MAAIKKRTTKTALTAQDRAKFMQHITSMMSRAQLGRNGKQFDGARDLYAVLGYKHQLEFADYMGAYERGDIAARIVDAKPESTWRRKPVVSNDGDPDKFTEFETAWAKLVMDRRVFHYLERADKLAGVGEYGCLLIGTSDVRKEADMKREMAKLKGPESILYLMPLSQESAEINAIEQDPRSPRFGLPSEYLVTVADVSASPNSTPTGLLKPGKMVVHWSRMLHIAEGLRESEIYGTPRLRAVFNRLWDVDKIAGGSAEVFWQAAKRIMVLEAKEGFNAVDDDDALTEMMDELIHGMRRVIDVQGYDVNTLETSDVKPDEAFRVSLALISSATGIPQRILLGSEQGKMASEQDEVNWNGRISDRQTNFAEPVILRPFIDRLISVGALPAPGNDYTVTWTTLFELSDKEKAQIGLLQARTIATFMGKAGENIDIAQQIVPIEEFRREILNMRSLKVENAAGGKSIVITPPPPKPVKPAKPAAGGAE